ncbi:MAG: Gfo/Idh/MocA family oxidoreductase [Defluviitaleaceae bacterium]|nr:Gfo/Idh/MocA family oxidoreductase [Defluviitaleaceae bacterium]
MEKTRIGIVGCGAISGIYLTNLTKMFAGTEVIGVCDLIDERAQKAVEEYNIPKKYKDMHELFADPQVDIMLNLTRPYEHYDVNMAAIAAGKHVYVEKPLGATLEEGIKTLEAAKAKGVVVAGAPDTFLGAGIQTCRKLIDDGFIGRPIAATAFMVGRGHETWHPDPEFYYQFGGGPMMDMGPYYITALVNLMGAVESVSGVTKKSFDTRRITSQPHFGKIVEVEVDTHITGQMSFANGAVGTIIQSFDVYAHNLPIIEIYGTEGTLSVPDPNTFGGPVRLYRPEQGHFVDMPLMFDYKDNSRGLGVADMAKAIATGEKPRAGIDLTFHVLEVMTAFTRSSQAKAQVEISSQPQRPVPMQSRLLPGTV